MSTTFRNSSMVLSIGIFFTLIILGLAATLPSALLHGLASQGVPAAGAASATALPPVSVLFASLLGYTQRRRCSGRSSPTWPRPTPPA
jgi:hypothetical protein